MSQHANESLSPAEDIPRLAEHLFRHEAGRLVSILTGIFGIDRLEMAEDVVQESLLRAMQTWTYYGVPRNPTAWIMQTAKNLALDLIRREKVFREKQPQIEASFGLWASDPVSGESPRFDDEIKDSRLRLMFACCHPLLPQEAQTALALKTLCGFSPGEIAKAFLTSEAAIAKRLTRARQKIRELQIPFEIPAGRELASRLESVLQILYFLFNEGYKASSGDSLIKEQLCQEAIRLAESLVEHPAADQPQTHALIALMYLDGARLPARTDEEGRIVRLKEQDRSLWNRQMIGRGLFHLSQAANGDELSEYHLQAGIAACHCIAADDQSTDWPRILAHYDQWIDFNDSPVVALNRAVAVAKVEGPEAGLEAIEAISNRDQMETYYLYHAVRGEFESQLDHGRRAAEHFLKALQLTELKSEKTFLLERLRECEGAGRGRSRR